MILVRLGGGPLGGSPVGTHCNATPRFEPVCSAVSGSLLSTPAAASTAGSPRWVRCWVERGDSVGLGRSSARNAVDLHRPTHLHKPHV